MESEAKAANLLVADFFFREFKLYTCGLNPRLMVALVSVKNGGIIFSIRQKTTRLVWASAPGGNHRSVIALAAVQYALQVDIYVKEY